MARLKRPPRASDEAAPLHSLSDASDSESATSEDVPANGHPVAESHSADVIQLSPALLSSRTPPPPRPVAVFGANLLNSARVDRHHSSHTSNSMGHRKRVGKLKRRTLIPESSKMNLAIRGDVYEIEVSPVKNNYVLPEKVNQEPLRVLKKKKQAAREPSADSPVSPDPRVHNADEPDPDQEVPAEKPTSQPGIDFSESNTTEASASGAKARTSAPEGIAIEENLPNGKPRCTAVVYKSDKKAGSGYQQCLNFGNGRTDNGVRCRIHINQAPTVQCGMMMASEEGTTQCPRLATAETTHGARCPAHAKDEEVMPRAKRKSASVHEEDQPANPSRRRRPGTHESASIGISQESRAAPGDRSDDEGSKYETAAEEDESATSPDTETAPPVERAPSIETVFKFLEIEECEGSCKTEPAKTLIRQCDNSCVKLQDETTSTETVAKDVAGIQEKLQSFSSVISEEHQAKFKSDAYRHVFHSLVTYLKALHDWLLKTHESVTESIEALRTVTPLLHAIVAFKDTIAKWNGEVPQSRKGDRPVKNIESYLIAPLRQVEKEFSIRLNRLEEAERRRICGAEMRRKMEEENEAEVARIEATEAFQERKKRWQSLHIVRMQCEPDIYRRRKLFHTRFEDLVERDANGVVFERLPIFKSRSAPPHSRISEIADETEWTESEETAVLEGLQQYAGPYVFEKMFKMYCDPRSRHPRAGDLRNRSVAEIVSKARWIRSAMLVLCQETGEPVEGWVTGIPVLP